MKLSKSILSYISEANKGEKWLQQNVTPDIIDRITKSNNDQILRRREVVFDDAEGKEIRHQKKIAGMAERNSDTAREEKSQKILANKKSFWSKAGNHISNHKVKYGVGAGALTAAGIGAAALHHHNKNKGILNKIKNNPGKAAGASLAALGAGAGAAALIRYLRKKRKNG